MQIIKSLEGGRGIAALIVALYHYELGAQNLPVLRGGYLFVDLFFVLSGFVICAAYSSRMNGWQDLQAFVIRRVGRLLPLLIFSTLAFLLAANLIVLAKEIALAYGYGAALNNPQSIGYLVPTTGELLATLTMTHSLGIFDHLILNTPSWSISTEFYAYLLFAGVCLLFSGATRLLVFLGLSIVGCAVTIWASVMLHHCLTEGGCLAVTYDFGFARTVFSFFGGALAFHASRTEGRDFSRLQWPAVALLVVMLAGVTRVPAIGFGFPLVFAVLILSISKDNGSLARLFNRRPIQVLGQRSYSIYLMHMPLVLFFENIAKRLDSPLAASSVMLAYAAVLIVVSGWTYRYVEDPFRVMFNRLASRLPRPAPATLLNRTRGIE
jgi:peptidoglycan/LPS O-acetylase OafA/YrhL